MSRSLRAVLATATSIMLIVGLAAPGMAARGSKNTGPKGKGNSTSSLAVVVIEPDGGEPRHGGTITFDVATDATEYPHVSLECRQGGEAVYWSNAGFFDSYPWPWAREFHLASDYWTGGPADCEAELYYHDGRRFRTLAGITFSAAG